MKKFIKQTIASVLMATTLVMCKKKDKLKEDSPYKITETNTTPVEQKFYNLDDETLKNCISNFMDYVSSNTNYENKVLNGGVVDTPLPLDSAVWIVEAALNFNFDREKNRGVTSDTKVDSVVMTNPVTLSTEGKLSPGEVADVYNFFKNYCIGINTNSPHRRIRIIDVIASTSNDGRVAYFSSFVAIANKPVSPLPGHCNPYTNQTAMWSYLFTQSCNPLTTNDGPTLVMNRLHCQILNSQACYGGYLYYTNVTTAFFNNSSNTYPSALYHLSSAPLCNMTTLTGTQLNGYVQGCQNIAIANLPPGPNIIAGNYYIQPAVFAPFSLNWWNLSITYGKPHCDQSHN